MKPTPDVLAAFGCAGELTNFDGGQGWVWRCGGAVLKPVGLALEAEWGAEVFASLEQVGFTVPRPIPAKQGGYVYRGWAASEFIAGEHPPVGRLAERFEVSRAFHAALSGVPDPGFFKERFDPWSIADRRVWGHADWRVHPRVAPVLAQFEALYEPVEQPWQVVHGDMVGNMIFRPDAAPAVIDFSPYWAPSGFAEAVMVVDVVLWERFSLTEAMGHWQGRPSLVARAAARRLLEVDTHFTLRGQDESVFEQVELYAAFARQLSDLD